MIRDPSDGSVKSAPDRKAPQHAERLPKREPASSGADTDPVIDAATSGLQTGSGKPENLARLNRSREWLVDYHAKKNAKPE